MSTASRGDPEAEAGGEQGPEHLGEGKEEESAPAKRVYGPHGGPREGEINKSEAEGCEQGGEVAGARLGEDSRRVEGHDVDCAGKLMPRILFSNKENGDLLPHICWAIITIPEA